MSPSPHPVDAPGSATASSSRAGRPRASSRETLADAACELFLEQGYDATSVSEITRRAGVSRSSFFNYFDSKADILWGAFDASAEAVLARLRAGQGTVRAALTALADDLDPDSLALAVANDEAMGIADTLVRERAVRQARLAEAVAARLRSEGMPPLRADVHAAAAAGAAMAAVWAWCRRGAGSASLPEVMADALGYAFDE